jgi:hypothetical protein
MNLALLLRRLPARVYRAGAPVCGAVAASALLAACSPALDWRDARLGGPVQLLMPCKPERVERKLALAGGPAEALMLVCDADGVTWSATRYELGDPARVGPALRELRAKLALNLGGPQSGAAARLDVDPDGHANANANTLPAGLARLPDAGRARLAGHRPNGDAVLAQALFFGEGGRAYQLVALLPGSAGKALQAQAGQFFDGVQLAR